MNFNHLKVFYEVAKRESISGAADALYLSKSAVSKSISIFEKELGVTLFERLGNHLKLTEVGKSVYEDTKVIIGDLEKFYYDLAKPSKTNTTICTYQMSAYWTLYSKAYNIIIKKDTSLESCILKLNNRACDAVFVLTDGSIKEKLKSQVVCKYKEIITYIYDPCNTINDSCVSMNDLKGRSIFSFMLDSDYIEKAKSLYDITYIPVSGFDNYRKVLNKTNELVLISEIELPYVDNNKVKALSSDIDLCYSFIFRNEEDGKEIMSMLDSKDEMKE